MTRQNQAARLPAQDLLAAWWQAIRPHSLLSALGPVAVAVAAALMVHRLRPWALVLVVLGSLLLQAGTNLANDYFDFRSGADRALGRGNAALSSPRSYLAGGIVALSIAVMFGLYVVLFTGFGLLAFAILAAVLGFEYTAPPLRLAYRGFGEAAVYVLMGPGLVAGAFYALTGSLSWLPVLAALPGGFFIAAVLHANNLRDLDEDRAIGKRTLAVRLGEKWARRELLFLLLAPYAVLLGCVWLRGLPLLCLATLVTLLKGAPLVRDFLRGRMEPGAVMRETGRLQILWSILLAGGLVLTARL